MVPDMNDAQNALFSIGSALLRMASNESCNGTTRLLAVHEATVYFLRSYFHEQELLNRALNINSVSVLLCLIKERYDECLSFIQCRAQEYDYAHLYDLYSEHLQYCNLQELLTISTMLQDHLMRRYKVQKVIF